jgi:hypothetical protein
MKPRHYPEKTITLCLKSYIATDGNLTKAATAAGVSQRTAAAWARTGKWADILASIKAEVDAQIAAEAVQQLVSIRSLALNIQYETLVFIYRKVRESGGEEFPFDAVKLAESMAKITGAGVDASKKDAGQFEVVDGAGPIT